VATIAVTRASCGVSLSGSLRIGQLANVKTAGMLGSATLPVVEPLSVNGYPAAGLSVVGTANGRQTRPMPLVARAIVPMCGRPTCAPANLSHSGAPRVQQWTRGSMRGVR